MTEVKGQTEKKMKRERSLAYSSHASRECLCLHGKGSGRLCLVSTLKLEPESSSLEGALRK